MLRHSWWLVGVFVVLLLAWVQPRSLQRLDLMAYDLLLPRQELLAHPPVVVAIDDASLAALGRWPWPRAVHADMINRLREAGASAIAMGILFSEPDTEHPDSDAALAEAIKRHGHVVLALAPSQLAGGGIGPQPLLPALGAGPTTSSLGHVDVEIDADGASRSLFLHAGNGDAVWPALALAVQQASAISAPAAATNAPTTWVRSQEALLPRVPDLTTISFVAALRNPHLLAQVRDRVVFIGLTASGLGGELVTPLAGAQSTMPSVVFHAKAYAALESHALIQRASLAASIAFALLMLISLAAWPRQHGRYNLLACSLLLLPLLASAITLRAAQLWLPPAVALCALAAGLAVWIAGLLRSANRRQQRARQHAQATLQALDEAVLIIDARDGSVRFSNPAALLLAGGQPLQGQPLLSSYPLTQDSQSHLQQALLACLETRQRVHVPQLLSLHAADGMRTLRARAIPLSSPDGQLDGAVLVFSDVTEAVASARELDYAASHDVLTGLPNRSALHERLAQALSRAQRSGANTALLFLDLDRFKHVNDSLGHSTGDQVLKILAQRLLAVCRDTDTVARWGGDEFVILLEDVDGHEGAASAAAKVLAALTRDIELGADFNDIRLPSSGSVGVVLAPQDGSDPDDLLSKADMAMYRAKEQPRASFQFWSNDMNSRMHNRLALEIDLRRGLRDGLFVLHYQPQFALDNRQLVGMEALMRWQRTPEQLVMPSDFIGVAEESDLIVDLGAWAILQAARQVAQWLRAGLPAVPVAVNLSARQCMNRDIVQVVRLALVETGIPPHLLRLEITETTAMANVDQVISLLQEIHALGVSMAVDDFGTGYSSLSHLKRFPIDELKIDSSFVMDLATDKGDAAIVRATIALAHGLGMKVVAEGVETEEQSRLLTAVRCDIAQGYWFGHPQPPQIATDLLANK
ncbi:EAL domain-containing protein [Rhodoferax sp.]|uniref:EAL domain-containing protein n=1 Tax=Rhodoferax sp. TaxID=50421 RepID=UPI002ACD7996|nr:EAL domain-containing protein [Rhodoferax sp.]MDZ7919595.1 EAL domain-containing protein [Rhodoferax sp.]